MNMKSILQNYAILATVLCTVLVGCDNNPVNDSSYRCQYGDFVFQYDKEMDGVYFGGVDYGKKIRDEVFFIPEKIYGLDVVGISAEGTGYLGTGYLDSKTIVIPKSVVKSISCFSNLYYKNLETLVILADKLNTIGEYHGSWTEKLNTVILCATTPPTIHGFNNERMFYVLDDSLYSYQTAYPRNALNFLPMSEYRGNLSKFNIDKPNWNYEIETHSPSWYYYDVYNRWNTEVILTNGVFHSEVYPVSGKNLYLNLAYKPNTIICDLEIFSEDDKPIVFPEPNDNYSRIYVYSETPVKIMYSDGDYPGYEITKIN